GARRVVVAVDLPRPERELEFVHALGAASLGFGDGRIRKVGNQLANKLPGFSMVSFGDIDPFPIFDVTAKIERVFIFIGRSLWIFRRFLVHKAIGDKGLLLILPKPSFYPRLLLGTFVGNVIFESRETSRFRFIRPAGHPPIVNEPTIVDPKRW